MIDKIKKASKILYGFFICFSVVVFLLNVLHLLIENVTKDINGIISLGFATCGCCCLIVMFVYKMIK